MKRKWVLMVIVVAIFLLIGLGFAGVYNTGAISAGEPASGTAYEPNDGALQAVKYVGEDWRVAQIVPTEKERNRDLQLIDSDGFWTLERLGYSEIVFPCQDRVEAFAIQYLLPDDVAQGPDHWYYLHLNMQIEFSEQSGEGSCEVIADANQRTANSLTFNSVTQDGATLISLGSNEFSSTLIRDVELSQYMPGYNLETNGLQPGLNTMTFLLVQRGDTKVQSLHILGNTSIERTSAIPEDLKQGTDMRRYARGLNAEDAALAKKIALSDTRVQELTAGKGYQVDFTGEWDFPQIDSRTVRVDVSLDKVYQIEYDWPWPPPPISNNPTHMTCWVREMTIIVDMDRQVVLGIMPERSPLAIDPADLPPELQPPGYQPSTKPVIPQLTEEERNEAVRIALGDVQIRELTKGMTITVDPKLDVGVWHTTKELRKIGAAVEIELGAAKWVEADWPCAEYDENKYDFPYYKDRVIHVASSVGKVTVLVDLGQQKVAAIIPLEVSEEVGK